jgi:BirA family transcriptional regulator, biotin operon repressor / biotin---[acetyl-CoA-carboxylase] ligase
MSWPFVRTLIRREVVPSTSDLARQLIVAGEGELPFAVWASRQTRGRGRGANLWWSDPGSLTFTVALDPSAHALRIEHEPRLALATAVAIIEAIVPLGLSQAPGIRWPNDIEAGGRKLGGILPERLETPSGPRLLIGIGLNVSSRLVDAPPEIQSLAASLVDLRPGPLPTGEAERLLHTILDGFASAVDRLAHDDPDLPARWEELDTLRGRRVRVDLGPRIVPGVCQGIDAEGALCLDTSEGPLRLFGGQVLRDPL